MPTKPKENYSTEVGRKGKDLFQTPNYATKLIIPYIPKGIFYIFEPACGYGKITEVLENHNYIVIENDLMYGFNFLDKKVEINKKFAIITNPPFSLKKQFLYKCVEYNVPFALLIPMDFNQWLCKAFIQYDLQAVVPTARIDYITPNKAENSSAQFHSFWVTRYFNLPQQLTFVELTKKMKENI